MLYLLEHAIWARHTGEVSAEADLEVFRRWVEDAGFGFAASAKEVEGVIRHGSEKQYERVRGDKEIVFGKAKGKQMAGGADEPQARARL